MIVGFVLWAYYTSPLRSHVLTALQQQLIRIAAVRNTNVPCRNLSAQDLSDATYIAHSPYMENIVSRRVDGGGGLQCPPRPNVTDALKKQIVKEVTEDLISPRELSNRHNLTVEKIRKIVKDSGNKLPNRYKHTASSKSRYTYI